MNQAPKSPPMTFVGEVLHKELRFHESRPVANVVLQSVPAKGDPLQMACSAWDEVALAIHDKVEIGEQLVIVGALRYFVFETKRGTVGKLELWASTVGRVL